jgi:hypothetical protein
MGFCNDMVSLEAVKEFVTTELFEYFCVVDVVVVEGKAVGLQSVVTGGAELVEESAVSALLLVVVDEDDSVPDAVIRDGADDDETSGT